MNIKLSMLLFIQGKGTMETYWLVGRSTSSERAQQNQSSQISLISDNLSDIIELSDNVSDIVERPDKLSDIIEIESCSPEFTSAAATIEDTVAENHFHSCNKTNENNSRSYVREGEGSQYVIGYN